jgi:hypothetical protein
LKPVRAGIIWQSMEDEFESESEWRDVEGTAVAAQDGDYCVVGDPYEAAALKIAEGEGNPDPDQAYLDAYEGRLRQYAVDMRAHYRNKHCFVISALAGLVNNEVLETNYRRCASKDGDADFCMTGLIRLMYLSERTSDLDSHRSSHDRAECGRAVARAERALTEFDAFWPHTGKSFPDTIVFWSENHILMLLSSAYLFRQWQFKKVESTNPGTTLQFIPINTEQAMEIDLLKHYLSTRAAYGMFEVLSHVYLPHSMAALLNLFDFADDPEIKTLASQTIDRIVQQLLLCTTDTGVVCLSASCRAFPRTRLRTFGHNVNQITRLLTGVGPDDFSPNSITDFLLTTSWRPFPALMSEFTFEGVVNCESIPSDCHDKPYVVVVRVLPEVDEPSTRGHRIDI